MTEQLTIPEGWEPATYDDFEAIFGPKGLVRCERRGEVFDFHNGHRRLGVFTLSMVLDMAETFGLALVKKKKRYAIQLNTPAWMSKGEVERVADCVRTMFHWYQVEVVEL